VFHRFRSEESQINRLGKSGNQRLEPDGFKARHLQGAFEAEVNGEARGDGVDEGLAAEAQVAHFADGEGRQLRELVAGNQ
jgi:hypothetical protein